MRQLKITKSVTPREQDHLDKYLQEIGKVKLLNAEEEVNLAKRIHQGDERALEELTKANLRFVVSVAKQYHNQGLSLADLINEGNLGLIKAGQRFDETRGFKFISYAVWWIRQSILQALAEDARIVRLPLNKVGSLGKINKALSALEQIYERLPSDEELAEVLNVSIDDIGNTMGIGMQHVSIDAEFIEGEDNSLLDVIPNDNITSTDDELVNKESLRKEIDRVLSSFSSDRNREIIKLYYGIGVEYPLNLDEIGNKFSITRERVRQIKEKALRVLRKGGRSDLLKKYLG